MGPTAGGKQVQGLQGPGGTGWEGDRVGGMGAAASLGSVLRANDPKAAATLKHGHK